MPQLICYDIPQVSVLIAQEKIPLHMCRPKLRFLRSTRYHVRQFFFFCFWREVENKQNHHGGFQQQSPQCLFDRYENMNRRHDCMILWLKAMPLQCFLINQKILKWYDVNFFDFDQLQFFRLEWSVSPLIINIIEQGVAHCLVLVKFI